MAFTIDDGFFVAKNLVKHLEVQICGFFMKTYLLKIITRKFK